MGSIRELPHINAPKEYQKETKEKETDRKIVDDEEETKFETTLEPEEERDSKRSAPPYEEEDEYVVKGTAGNIHPRALQSILDAVRDRPEETVISTVMLRSMKQAKYDPQSLGHFGLSTEFYTHFTSPIRRYPDLIVHRLIRTYLINGKVDEATQEKWLNACRISPNIHHLWSAVQLTPSVRRMI